MKLPTYENDYYVLDDGEAVHKVNLDSFWIPEKEKRESLVKGDLVKLIFRMEETKGSDDIAVERMWVKITESIRVFYIGFLDNDPASK